MSIAIDRYFVILFPFKSRMQIVTCTFIIVAIWLTTSVLTLPYAHFMQLGPGESIDPSSGSPPIYCDERWPNEETRKAFAVCTTFLQFVIPCIIITFCYVRVCGKLLDRAKTIPGSVSTRREEQERDRTKKTNRMLISMVIIFVVSWFPLNIYNLLVDFYAETNTWKYRHIIFLFVHAVAMSSTCYNPFLYAWLNENFRKEFKEILPCCGKLKLAVFSSTLLELRQASSSRRSSYLNSSKRCVKLHLTEPLDSRERSNSVECECSMKDTKAHSFDQGKDNSNQENSVRQVRIEWNK